jgi:hypothetical protein
MGFGRCRIIQANFLFHPLQPMPFKAAVQVDPTKQKVDIFKDKSYDVYKSDLGPEMTRSTSARFFDAQSTTNSAYEPGSVR